MRMLMKAGIRLGLITLQALGYAIGNSSDITMADQNTGFYPIEFLCERGRARTSRRPLLTVSAV
ncbi:hypothetical protein CVH10_12090 [Halomonas sp. ND22Bw]|nr:hypothetical protein CVH10_12090 [Halomonas sp. ND22Bw]